MLPLSHVFAYWNALILISFSYFKQSGQKCVLKASRHYSNYYSNLYPDENSHNSHKDKRKTIKPETCWSQICIIVAGTIYELLIIEDGGVLNIVQTTINEKIRNRPPKRDCGYFILYGAARNLNYLLNVHVSRRRLKKTKTRSGTEPINLKPSVLMPNLPTHIPTPPPLFSLTDIALKQHFIHLNEPHVDLCSKRKLAFIECAQTHDSKLPNKPSLDVHSILFITAALFMSLEWTWFKIICVVYMVDS